jgi:hypothetical protein
MHRQHVQAQLTAATPAARNHVFLVHVEAGGGQHYKLRQLMPLLLLLLLLRTDHATQLKLPTEVGLEPAPQMQQQHINS